MGSREQALFELLEPQVNSQGVDLVEVRWGSSGSRASLRIVIHSRSGVSHGDCARVTRAVERALDEKAIPGSYVVEVSSPGLDRLLRERREFEVFRGRRVRIWTSDEETERVGIAQGFGPEDEIRLQLDTGEVLSVPWAGIKKARLVPEVRGVGGNS